MQPGNRISSFDYLTSVSDLSEFIGKFGLIFWTVRADIQHNVNIVKQFFIKDPRGCKFLDQLLRKAKEAKDTSWFRGWNSNRQSNLPNAPPKMTPPVEGLIWTHRTMAFFCHILRKLIADHEAMQREPFSFGLSNDLRPYFHEAWRIEIEPAATWLMKMLFEVVIS